MGTRLAVALSVAVLAACGSSGSDDELRRACDAVAAPGTTIQSVDDRMRDQGFAPSSIQCPPFGERNLPRLAPLSGGDTCPYDSSPVCTVSYFDTFAGNCGSLRCSRCELRVIRTAATTGDDLAPDAPVCATAFIGSD
jgi:hypothetical protein